jgi:hypothetical protein
VRAAQAQLGRRRLVRAKGLEPPHLAILEPKSSASTSSATPAQAQAAGLRARSIAKGAQRTTRDETASCLGSLKGAKEILVPVEPPIPQPDAPPPEAPPLPGQPGPSPDAPQPAQPGQPDAPAPEIVPPGPDVDVPSPGGDPGGHPIQPIG